jgi:hypothetical protein
MTAFLLGILTAATAFAPLVAYALNGWRRAERQRRTATYSERTARMLLASARGTIERLTPLAETGRKRRAASEKYKAKGRGK